MAQYKYTLKIDGMMCGMCEAHINDVIRNAFPDAKKVSSSHTKNRSTFEIDHEVNPDSLKKAIEDTGYHYLSYEKETMDQKKKKKFLGLF